MIQPIEDKLPHGLRQNGRALPRGADDLMSVPALQHIGSTAHDFVDQSTAQMPPVVFPSPGDDKVYAVYADAEPYHRIQPHVYFRAPLVTSAAPWGGTAIGTQSVFTLPNDICALTQTHLHDLRW